MTPQIKQRIEQIRRGEVPAGYKKTKAGVIPSEWELHPLSKHLTESRIPGTNGAVAKKLTVKLWNKGVFEKIAEFYGDKVTVTNFTYGSAGFTDGRDKASADGIPTSYKDYGLYQARPKTAFDTVVVQSDDNSYYLKKDIYGKYTTYGVPFYDYRMTDFENLHMNNVIYGHNMRSDDLIFGMLENYRDISGFRQAPVIECNTIYGDHTWFVYAAFLTNSKESDDNGYVLPYNFIDIGDQKFEAYIEEIDKRKFTGAFNALVKKGFAVRNSAKIEAPVTVKYLVLTDAGLAFDPTADAE